MIRWLWKIFLRGLKLLFSFGSFGALVATRQASARLLDDGEISSLDMLEKDLSLRYGRLCAQEEKLRSAKESIAREGSVNPSIEQEIQRLSELRGETERLLNEAWRAKGVVVYRRVLHQLLQDRPSCPSTQIAFIIDYQRAAGEFHSGVREWEQYRRTLQRQRTKIPTLTPPRQGGKNQQVIDEVRAERSWLDSAISREITSADRVLRQLNVLVEWCQSRAITVEGTPDPVEDPRQVIAELGEFDILLPTGEQLLRIDQMIGDIEEVDRAEREVEEALRRYIPTRYSE